MKLIIQEPRLHKWWRNSWSSEEKWEVINNGWGFIEDDFWEKIKIFQSLNFSKDYQSSLDKWKRLMDYSPIFMSTAAEFIALKYFKKYTRMACYAGKNNIQLFSLSLVYRRIKIQIICKWRNLQLKWYYKKNPFEYYENYYPGIKKDKKRFYQNLSKTLNKWLQ